MASPVQLNSPSQGSNQGVSGPIVEVNGNLYVVLFDQTLSAYVMLKSTDKGTTWATVGGHSASANRGDYGYAVVAVGALIYVVGTTLKTVSNPVVFYQVQAFSTGADTWGAVFTSTLTPSAVNTIPAWRIAAFYDASHNRIYAVGNASASITWDLQYWYLNLSTGTFVGQTAIGPGGASDLAISGILPSNTANELQFIYVAFDKSNVLTSKILYRQALNTATDTLGPVNVIDNLNDTHVFNYRMVNCSANVGITPNDVIIVWQPSTADTTKFNVYQGVAGTWIFTKTTLTSPGNKALIGIGCVIGNDGKSYALLTNDQAAGNQNFYFWNSGTTFKLSCTQSTLGPTLIWAIPQPTKGFYSAYGDIYTPP